MRIVEGIEGKVQMQARIARRFGYGKLPAWTRETRDGVLMTVGADALLLRSSARMEAQSPDVRAGSVVGTIERELMFDGSIVRDEGRVSRDATGARRPMQSAFLACNAWLVENCAMTGRLREARSLFERLLSAANDVGLPVEEYDVRARRLVGNVPQTLSHATLVNAAVRPSRAEPRG